MNMLYRSCMLLGLVLSQHAFASGSVVDQHQSGTKYSPLTQITRGNITDLDVAWEYHTGDGANPKPNSLTSFQDQPSMIEGNLVVCTTNRRIIALNPKTGEEIPITARRVVTFRPGQKLKARVEAYAGTNQ